MENRDPILAALARIEAKTDQTLQNQQAMKAEIAEIHKDTKRTAAVVGGVSGAVGGGIVSVGWQLIKAKMGL
ncbi:hypothetical protein EGK75_07455 [Neisseria weixii]|uniref:Uncharacterized protein n=1 Tax=Neisseria weixii TaxID=1853276 RepID=A0A3N4MR75_9NEIS|nr:hypothetical protein [Neisseria weixii]RPD86211.1 hypothetical protein EGK74_08170 [Neisseria weixii]RPD87195.1 hypothetical protein EGK75_07455 [Neisseria weixii]